MMFSDPAADPPCRLHVRPSRTAIPLYPSLCARTASPDRARRHGTWGLLLGLTLPGAVPALEALDPATGVDELLLAGEEGVALVAQLDPQLGLDRAGGERVAAGAADAGGHVVRVSCSLHVYLLVKPTRVPVRRRRWLRGCSTGPPAPMFPGRRPIPV